MNKIIPIAIIIAIIVVFIGVLAFAQTNNQTTVNNNSSNNMENMSNMNSTSNESQANVIIKNGTFSPSLLMVTPGTTVVWTVEDPTGKYMVTSNKTSNGMNLFMSDDLTNGKMFNYTFNQTGTFDYYDMDHMNNKSLVGTIVVQ
jgi:plastocyanin